jgi:hypothetical protein
LWKPLSVALSFLIPIEIRLGRKEEFFNSIQRVRNECGDARFPLNVEMPMEKSASE